MEIDPAYTDVIVTVGRIHRTEGEGCVETTEYRRFLIDDVNAGRAAHGT